MGYTVLYLDGCGYSQGAVELLKEEGIHFKLIIFSDDIKKAKTKHFKTLNKNYDIGVENSPEIIFDKKLFKDYFGPKSTFPRVYEGEKLIGGYSELKEKLS
jgi:glutaredoxin